MRNKNNSLKSDRNIRTLISAPLRCDTKKFGSKKKRLCLKCGNKFLSENPYNRICEKCSFTNKKIEQKTHSVSLKPLGAEKSFISLYSNIISW